MSDLSLVNFRIQRKVGQTILDPGCISVDLKVNDDQLLGIAYFTYCCGQEFRLMIDGKTLESWISEFQEITEDSRIRSYKELSREPTHKYCIGLIDDYISTRQIPENAIPGISFEGLSSYLVFDTRSFLQGMKAAVEWFSLPVHLNLYRVLDLESGSLREIQW